MHWAAPLPTSLVAGFHPLGQRCDQVPLLTPARHTFAASQSYSVLLPFPLSFLQSFPRSLSENGCAAYLRPSHALTHSVGVHLGLIPSFLFKVNLDRVSASGSIPSSRLLVVTRRIPQPETSSISTQQHTNINTSHTLQTSDEVCLCAFFLAICSHQPVCRSPMRSSGPAHCMTARLPASSHRCTCLTLSDSPV